MSAKWGDRLLHRFGPALVTGLIRGLGATLRLQVRDEHGFLTGPRAGCVGVFWHNRILMMPWIYGRLHTGVPLSVMISRSKDGSLIADTAARFGVGALRGSSSKGAAEASREALRALAAGEWVGITPDGPRGPLHDVKPGLANLVRKARVPVMPVRVVYGWKLQAGSWDRFQIPLPFSRVEVVIGAPIAPDDPELASKVKAALGI